MRFLISILLAIPVAQAAVDKEIKPQKYILCKNKSIVRTIRVEADGSSCQAKYTKAGVDRVIGYGSSPGACNRFVDNVKTNLENASWACRSLSDSKITAQSPEPEEDE